MGCASRLAALLVPLQPRHVVLAAGRGGRVVFECSASTLYHKPLKHLSCSISAWSCELKGGVETGGWARGGECRLAGASRAATADLCAPWQAHQRVFPHCPAITVELAPRLAS